MKYLVHIVFSICACLVLQTVEANNHVTNPSQNILGFLFISLFIGSIASYALSRSSLSIPYTVVIFAFGIVVSALREFTHNSMENSISMWDNIDPHLILYIFLPALLFGEAMSLNFHHFSNALPVSLLFAGPGALFCAAGMAVGVNTVCLMTGRGVFVSFWERFCAPQMLLVSNRTYLSRNLS